MVKERANCTSCAAAMTSSLLQPSTVSSTRSPKPSMSGSDGWPRKTLAVTFVFSANSFLFALAAAS